MYLLSVESNYIVKEIHCTVLHKHLYIILEQSTEYQFMKPVYVTGPNRKTLHVKNF